MDKKPKTSVERPVLAQLREMEVGDIIVFPMSRRSTIKTMCSEYGLEWNKTFSTSSNREARTISVTRKA